MIAINQTFPPGAYIFHTRETLSFPARHNTISPLLSSSCRVALYSSPSRTSARTEIGRAGLRNPTACIATHARVCGQSGFWGASSAIARRRDRLLALQRIGVVFFLVDVRDCDYFVSVFFLVDVRGTAPRISSYID